VIRWGSDDFRKTLQLIELNSMAWPESLKLPSRRFRLLVASDVTAFDAVIIQKFAHAALSNGMAYLCVWGPGCSRFHDIVDDVIAYDDATERLFAGPNNSDTVMTTWHDNESLNEAIEYFLEVACPTDGFASDSDYWLAISLGNAEWTRNIGARMEEKFT
jgi:hypothetical protein